MLLAPPWSEHPRCMEPPNLYKKRNNLCPPHFWLLSIDFALSRGHWGTFLFNKKEQGLRLGSHEDGILFNSCWYSIECTHPSTSSVNAIKATASKTLIIKISWEVFYYVSSEWKQFTHLVNVVDSVRIWGKKERWLAKHLPSGTVNTHEHSFLTTLPRFISCKQFSANVWRTLTLVNS